MKIVVATDSYKGTMTASVACAAISEGLRNAVPGADVRCVPLADGGEGTLDTIVTAMGGLFRSITVSGPLGDQVSARYGVWEEGRKAVIEMAEASGLLLVAEADRNVMQASTFGTGELIRHALANGAKEIIVAIGGSATCDGGCGAAQALGVRFLTRDGAEIKRALGGGDLRSIGTFDVTGTMRELHGARIKVLCDVRNQMVGACGAAKAYAPQKGATPSEVESLDAGLRAYGTLIERELGIKVLEIKGCGAAGGLGAGLMAFARGHLYQGAPTVMEAVKLEEACADAEAIITGEGCLDEQSLCGKVVEHVAKLGRRLNKPVYVIAGKVRISSETTGNRFAKVAGVVEPDATLPTNPATALRNCAESCSRQWFTG